MQDHVSRDAAERRQTYLVAFASSASVLVQLNGRDETLSHRMIRGVEPQCQNLAVWLILHVGIVDHTGEGHGILRHNLSSHVRTQSRIEQHTQSKVAPHDQPPLSFPIDVYPHDTASICFPDAVDIKEENGMTTEDIAFVLLAIPRWNGLERESRLRNVRCLPGLHRRGKDIDDALREGLCCSQQREGVRRGVVVFSRGSQLNLDTYGCLL